MTKLHTVQVNIKKIEIRAVRMNFIHYTSRDPVHDLKKWS